jgi:plastocyanin
MKKLTALAALALAALALVACGSSNDESSKTGETSGSGGGAAKEEGGSGSKGAGGGSGSTLEFEADPEGALAYTTSEATTSAGKVTIDFNNPQSLTHDLVIEDSSGEDVARNELIADGSNSTTANLKPGTYTFFCSVPGHREAGMEGTLTVK